jgi:hypothetical protein
MAAVGGFAKLPDDTQPEAQQLYEAMSASVQGTATEAQEALVAAAVATAGSCAPLLVLFEPTVNRRLLYVEVPQGVALMRAAEDLWLTALAYLEPELQVLASFLQTFHSFSLRTPAAHHMQMQQAEAHMAKAQQAGQLASSSDGSVSPAQPLTQDEALMLLCQPGLVKERLRLRNKVAGTNHKPLHGPKTLQLLWAVYYLPAVCDDLLQTLLCQHSSSEVCAPEVKASRLQLLKKHAHDHVEGFKNGTFQDVAAVRLP